MRFFHVSENNNMSGKIINPKVPINKMSNEEKETPRICVSPSVNGCLTAIGGHEVGEVLYVYECFSEEYIQPTEKEVLDAPLTGEIWLLKPTKMTHFATIKIKEVVLSKINEMENNLYAFDIIKNKMEE